MASKEINLIPDKTRLSPDEERKFALIKRLTTLTLAIFACVLLAVFGTSIFIRQQITTTEAGIESERGKIKALKKNEGTYLLLKQKAAVLKTILSGRYNFIDVFSFFREMENRGGKIQTITLSESGEVVITIVVADSGALDSYINELLAVAETRFGRIEMQGVQFNPTGNFSVTFAISMANKEPA